MNTEAVTYDLTFRPFAKMARLSRECVITEKLDGTNAQIYILPEVEYDTLVARCLLEGRDVDARRTATVSGHVLLSGSRTRWIRPKNPGEKGDPDNYGFAAWVKANAEELVKLGPGKHFGEWFGSGINRAYGLVNGDRRFALFNVHRWVPNWANPQSVLPGVVAADGTGEPVSCCYVVPTLYRGPFSTSSIELTLNVLETLGSNAVPGFKSPEGIVIYHTASGALFKKTILNDESPKGVPGLTKPSQLAAGKQAADEAFKQKVEQP